MSSKPVAYKVWAQIERQQGDDYANADEPVGIAFFDGPGALQQARAFVNKLSADGYDTQGRRIA